ncbi:N-acetylmuramoyl-L-alanine amidase [Clostridium magnum]|uniref:Sporulation-specific N-acetylmuramoyl-L-alanine amidase n=1 Tax=Clostridium magnum DSM 2767 TaxID=1121326 RepID=A0A162UJB1_9CLOT|nr:N-acetylmuramoyl-L-alanine amidase [Clostridium magnum]KZL93984.1 sporulation-specific N-acetylmuramoyl-L-alanine amidase [Clostridium magnum DSM 2767]SHH99841.1 N-acetylmuramoyl-L-alanine amidase [Clostridium magnum DSM 2767]
MARLCFDYGHGGDDPGATYNNREESNDVLDLGKAVAAEVRRHGAVVDETRTSDATVSLNDRSAFENRNTYDYFISFHRNAYEPEKARGAETYTYLNSGAKSKSLAQRIQTSLVALGFTDRGVKEANYYVLRETKAPAVLIEIGFIDNTEDNNLFDSKRNGIIKGLAKEILAQVGVDYVETSIAIQPEDGQTLYRVMAGSYSVRENAENQVQKLKAAGFDATIIIFNK